MASTVDLSYAFLEAHPADAARVLERVAPQNVAALFATAPVRISAPVLRSMLPLHAARCLETVDDDTASGLLRAAGPQAGVAVLHYVPEMRRHALLERLPTALSVAFRLLLGYPGDTVGAWMNPRILALPMDTTVAVALQRLRETDNEYHSCIFVLGSGQRLMGQFELVEVLRASPDLPLSRIMGRVQYTLPARASIRTVGEHAGWDDFQTLPVVERGDRLVGALERGVLARALIRNDQSPASDDYGDVVAGVASSYWRSVAGLIQFTVGLLPVVTQNRARGGDGDAG